VARGEPPAPFFQVKKEAPVQHVAAAKPANSCFDLSDPTVESMARETAGSSQARKDILCRPVEPIAAAFGRTAVTSAKVVCHRVGTSFTPDKPQQRTANSVGRLLGRNESARGCDALPATITFNPCVDKALAMDKGLGLVGALHAKNANNDG